MNTPKPDSTSPPRAQTRGPSERGAEATRRDVPERGDEATRRDIPERGAEATRQDVPERGAEATRFSPTAPLRGTLKSIAHRPTDGLPMIEATQVNVLPGRGIDTENRKTGKREITLVSTKSWTDACRDLGTTVPWHFRRANLLIEGLDLSATIGKTIKIGPVELLIHGETRPCGIMDQQHQGLKAALVAEVRGGVHAQVLVGGALRVGDSVVLA